MTRKKKIINLIISIPLYAFIWVLYRFYMDYSRILPNETKDIAYCRKVCIFCLIAIAIITLIGIITKFILTKQIFRGTGLLLVSVPLILFLDDFLVTSVYDLPNELKWSFIKEVYSTFPYVFELAVFFMLVFSMMVSSYYRGIKLLDIGEEIEIPKFFNVILYFNNPDKKTKISVVYQSLMAIYFIIFIILIFTKKVYVIEFIGLYLILIFIFGIIHFTVKRDLV